jgi:hypothetical protein
MQQIEKDEQSGASIANQYAANNIPLMQKNYKNYP